MEGSASEAPRVRTETDVGPAPHVTTDAPSAQAPAAAALDGGPLPSDGSQGKKARSLRPRFPPVYPVFGRPTLTGVRPEAVQVHPKGFRMLSKRSPLERGMTSYFRTAPLPPKRLIQEQQALRQTIDRDVRKSGVARLGNGVVLDGWMLSAAAGVEDPIDATTVTVVDSNLTDADPEHLGFFSSLTHADLGENHLPLAALTGLSSLRTLHLHCNMLETLGELPSATVFPTLHTLNLAFNCLGPGELEALVQLPVLQRLDLSNNGLKTLPWGFRKLRTLRQLALERNKLHGATVFHVLSRMPSLEEVNLNFNKITTVPSTRGVGPTVEGYDDDSGDGQAPPLPVDPTLEEALQEAPDAPPPPVPGGTRFARLAVLGLGSNNITFFEDVYNVSEMPALQQLVLWGNPIASRPKDAAVLRHELQATSTTMDQDEDGGSDGGSPPAAGVCLVLEQPVPPKRKKAAFFTESRAEHVKVPPVDGRGLPRKRRRAAPMTAPAATTAAATSGVEPQQPTMNTSTTAGEATTGGGGFFMTEAHNSNNNNNNNNNNNTAVDPFPVSSSQAPTGPSSSSAQQQHRPQVPVAGGVQAGTSSRVGRQPPQSQRGGGSPSVLLPTPIGSGMDDRDGPGAAVERHTRPTPAAARLRQTAAETERALQQPPAVPGGRAAAVSMRTAVHELRNMLRQPLPALTRPGYAGGHRGGPEAQWRRSRHGVAPGGDGLSSDDDDGEL